MRRSLGFTLLELLVVFSIIGLLTGVGFAAFISYGRKQTIDQAAFDAKTGIDQARFNAVSRVKPAGCGAAVLDRFRFTLCDAGLCNDPTNLYEVDAVCVSGATETPVTVGSKKRSSSITATVTSADCGSNRSISFYPLKGGTDMSLCRMVLTSSNGGISKTLCINNGGQVTIKDGTAATPATCP